MQLEKLSLSQYTLQKLRVKYNNKQTFYPMINQQKMISLTTSIQLIKKRILEQAEIKQTGQDTDQKLCQIYRQLFYITLDLLECRNSQVMPENSLTIPPIKKQKQKQRQPLSIQKLKEVYQSGVKEIQLLKSHLKEWEIKQAKNIKERNQLSIRLQALPILEMSQHFAQLIKSTAEKIKQINSNKETICYCQAIINLLNQLIESIKRLVE